MSSRYAVTMARLYVSDSGLPPVPRESRELFKLNDTQIDLLNPK